MFPAILGRKATKPAPPDKAWTPPGPHSASIQAWISNCARNSLALEMRLEGRTWRVQTVPPVADQTARELGEAVAQALSAESKGVDWHRQDAIISRALEAVGSGAFMDYLVALGEVEFKEGT